MSRAQSCVAAVGFGLNHATLGHISVTLRPAAGGYDYEVRGYRDALLAEGSLGAGGTHWARDQAIADAVARHEKRTARTLDALRPKHEDCDCSACLPHTY